MNQLLKKAPPQNIEAEESLLSSILRDEETIHEIANILDPEDFYKFSHQKIYGAALNLFKKNEPVDIVTIDNELRKNNMIEKIGGATYLTKLIDTTPIAINSIQYAKIIKEKSSIRNLISKSTKIVEKCYDSSNEFEEIINYAEKSIFEIAEKKDNENNLSISDLINGNIDTIEKQQENASRFTGTCTGFMKIDEMTSGLQNSDLIIIAARPSMGKTAFALNIARNVAVDSNIPVAVFSLEMSASQLSMRLLLSEARVSQYRYRNGFVSSDDWEALSYAAGIISEAPIFIDDSGEITAMDIRTKARKLKRESGIGLIIVDYLQLMKSKNNNDRRDLEIAEISRSLKMIAKELNIPVVALSQLNRSLESRNNKRPIMSDLRESGALEQDADIIAFIYRDEVYNKEEDNPEKGKAEIIISKHRNGAIGTAYLSWIGDYTRFEDIAYDNYN